MFQKLFCSMVVTVIGIGFVAADEFTATITKVDGDKITYQKFKKKEKDKKEAEKDGDAVEINAKGAKVVFGTVKDGKFEAGDAVEGGLKNEIFGKAVSARLTTEGTGKDAKVTQIGITKKKKKAAE